MNLLLDRVAFTIGSLEIYWYGIIITGAILAGTIFTCFECKRRKRNPDYVLSLFLWVVPLAILFARLAYVIFHPSSYFPLQSFKDFLHIFDIREGGISILGAIPGGALGAFINFKIHKEFKFVEVLDMLSPGMILGQALGRWGNFMNQELYGMEITNEALQFFPIAVKIVDERTGAFIGWFQATFFYEMVLNLIGFALLVVISRKIKKNGVMITFYLFWYCLVRAIMELLREDAVVKNGIHIGTLGCGIVAGVALIVILLISFGRIKVKTPSHLIEKTTEPEDSSWKTQKEI